jgi:hypothetical protein
MKEPTAVRKIKPTSFLSVWDQSTCLNLMPSKMRSRSKTRSRPSEIESTKDNCTNKREKKNSKTRETEDTDIDLS